MRRRQIRSALDAGQHYHYFHPVFRFFYRTTAAFACLAASLASSSTSLLAGEGYVTAGIGGGLKTLNSYQAIIYAPFGKLSESGLILRGWTRSFRFAYQTDLPAASNVTISAMGLSVEGEAGWQFTLDQLRIAVFGGIVWRQHMLLPDDPGSTLDQSRIGFSATIDGEYKFSDDYGIMANASFLQGFDQFWVQAKPYRNINFGGNWKFGLDVSSAGGADYNNSRVGVFASDYEFSFWSGKRMFLGAEAGVKFSLKDKQTTPYAGINVGYLF